MKAFSTIRSNIRKESKTIFFLTCISLIMVIGSNPPLTVSILYPPDGTVISNIVDLTALVSGFNPPVRIEWYMDGDTNTPIAVWTNPIPSPTNARIIQ